MPSDCYYSQFIISRHLKLRDKFHERPSNTCKPAEMCLKTLNGWARHTLSDEFALFILPAVQTAKRS